jgi:hypothetical protein
MRLYLPSFATYRRIGIFIGSAVLAGGCGASGGAEVGTRVPQTSPSQMSSCAHRGAGGGAAPLVDWIGIATLEQLVADSDAVILARPVESADRELARFEDPEVGADLTTVWFGRSFDVVEVWSGDSVSRGDTITVGRFSYEARSYEVEPSGDGVQRTSCVDSSSALPRDLGYVQPFDAPGYVFGLTALDDVQGLAGTWMTTSGPFGIIELDGVAPDAQVIAPGASVNRSALQSTYAGDSVAALENALRAERS